jgi:hypothetical protein
VTSLWSLSPRYYIVSQISRLSSSTSSFTPTPLRLALVHPCAHFGSPTRHPYPLSFYFLFHMYGSYIVSMCLAGGLDPSLRRGGLGLGITTAPQCLSLCPATRQSTSLLPLLNSPRSRHSEPTARSAPLPPSHPRAFSPPSSGFDGRDKTTTD